VELFRSSSSASEQVIVSLEDPVDPANRDMGEEAAGETGVLGRLNERERRNGMGGERGGGLV